MSEPIRESITLRMYDSGEADTASQIVLHKYSDFVHDIVTGYQKGKGHWITITFVEGCKRADKIRVIEHVQEF